MNRKAGIYFGLAGVLLITSALGPFSKIKDSISNKIAILFQRIKVDYNIRNPLELNLELFFKVKNDNIFFSTVHFF